MQGFVLTHEGGEGIALDELRRFGVSAENLIFDAPPEKVAEACYRGQSFTHAGIFLGWLDCQQEPPAEAKGYLPARFCVRGKGDLDGIVGEKLIALTPGSTVDFKQPEKRFFLFDHEGKVGLGIEPMTFDLAKRDYKVFHHSGSIKGTVAFCLVMLSGYSPGKLFLDPFTCSGEVCIEAALLSTRSPHFYRKKDFLFEALGVNVDLAAFDALYPGSETRIHGLHKQLAFVKSSQKNAKIANVHKHVEFGRGDVEWLDTKFEEDSVDCIVSKVPSLQPKVQNELFYQAAFILKKDGLMTLACASGEGLKEAAAKNAFAVADERFLWQGKEPFTVITFKKA
ncbi:MAG: hypothetical protein V1735_02060 [Nanoarchaeota archaeon]